MLLRRANTFNAFFGLEITQTSIVSLTFWNENLHQSAGITYQANNLVSNFHKACVSSCVIVQLEVMELDGP